MPRIFIGVKMSEEIERLAANWSSNKQAWPVCWVSPRNLHLTLVPPFYEDKVKIIAAKLEDIQPLPAPVVLRFQTLSFGPRPGDYRLIWAVGRPSLELEKLKTEIEKKLNVETERRKFLPHLTLARFRPEDYNRLRVKNLKEQISWLETVTGFVLFESVLKPTGAEYKILNSFEK